MTLFALRSSTTSRSSSGRRPDLPGRLRGLILVPAVSAHGRIWEKTAAGLLSIFVLAALLVVGVVPGLVIVYYYPDISSLFNS